MNYSHANFIFIGSFNLVLFQLLMLCCHCTINLSSYFQMINLWFAAYNAQHLDAFLLFYIPIYRISNTTLLVLLHFAAKVS